MDFLFNNVLVRKYVESLLVELAKGAVVKLHELRIISSENRAIISLELLGENEPLTVTLDGYKIEEENTLFIQSLATSKPWITVALKSFLAANDNRVRLPDSLLSKVFQKLI